MDSCRVVRRAARIDANQAAIVAFFRRAGASVQILSSVGQGCPDLLVGYHLRNQVVEVKDGARAPSERRLTASEEAWHAQWKGSVRIAESIDDAKLILQEMSG